MARWCITALLLATAGPATAQPAEGRLEGDGVQVEILATPMVVGERIDLPEGWFRVEEEGIEDRQIGSFSVVARAEPEPATAPAAPSAASSAVSPAVPSAASLAVSSEPSPQAPPAVRSPPDPCRAERSAYLRELWRTSGVEVEDPEALLEGLGAGEGAATGYYWFALQTDPIRAMAWSADLRARAGDLTRCVHGQRAARGG